MIWTGAKAYPEDKLVNKSEKNTVLLLLFLGCLMFQQQAKCISGMDPLYVLSHIYRNYRLSLLMIMIDLKGAIQDFYDLLTALQTDSTTVSNMYTQVAQAQLSANQ